MIHMLTLAHTSANKSSHEKVLSKISISRRHPLHFQVFGHLCWRSAFKLEFIQYIVQRFKQWALISLIPRSEEKEVSLGMRLGIN